MMTWKNIQFTETQIVELLEALGFLSISNNANEFKFAWEEGSSPNGVCLFKKNLFFEYWSKHIHGDIIELIKYKMGFNYRDSFVFLEKFLNKKISFQHTMPQSALSTYIRELSELIEEDDSYEVYDERMLDDYQSVISELWLKDNINTLTQYKFKVLYDPKTKRIGLPIRDKNGQLVGVNGRFNATQFPDYIPKYFPILNYRKSLFLFGMYENRDYLDDTIILVESEKSVLKAFGYGMRNVLALGTCRISEAQKRLIEEINPKKVIVALDEGLTDDLYKIVAEKAIPTNPLCKYEVWYVKSNDCGLAPKESIFDCSKELIDDALTNHVVQIY